MSVLARRPRLRPWRRLRVGAAIGMTLLVVGGAQPARAVHVGGSRTQTVAFSGEGLLLVRHVAVQHGVLRYEILRLPDGQTVESRDMGPDDDPEVVERELRARHGLQGAGFPGPVAPDRGAAVLVLPGRRSRTGAFEYTVQLTDGEGPRDVALIPVQHDCVQPREGTHSLIRAHWAPDGRTVVLVGSVVVEAECDVPREEPVLVVVRAGPRAPRELLAGLAESLVARVRALLLAGDPEVGNVLQQALALAPERVDLVVLLARLRVRRARLGAALAALWALARRPGAEARQALGESMAASWTDPLRDRAAWRALEWTLAQRTGSSDSDSVVGRRRQESAQPRARLEPDGG